MTIDLTAIVVALIGAIPPSILAGLGLVAALRAGRHVAELEHGINSRMDQLVETTRAEASASGEAKGRAAERNRPAAKKKGT